MKMNRVRLAVSVLVFLSAVFSTAAQSPREAFKQMVEQLSQNPGDDSLREKLIQTAATLDPAPAIPEDARRYLIEGMTLHQESKSPEDEKTALDSFSKALQLAPWWGDIYIGQSVSQELTGQLDAAEKSLHFYLLSNPGEEKARSAQDHIYVLEAKQKKAQASVQASQQEVDQRKNLTGWWQCKTGCGGYKWVQSDGSDLSAQIDKWSLTGHFEQGAFTGLATLPASADLTNPACAIPEQKHRMTLFMEDDGSVIRLNYESTTYQTKSHAQPDPIFGYLSPTQVCDSVTPVNTSPEEVVLVGGAKQSSFGVGIKTITADAKDMPSDKEMANVVKDGFNYCKRSDKVGVGGVTILSVEPGSAAEAGGLKVGDVIHLQSRSDYRGATIFCTAEDLSSFLKGIPPGNKFSLEVYDGSKHAELREFVMGIRGEPLEANLETVGAPKKRGRK
jgi:hypothetical protein